MSLSPVDLVGADLELEYLARQLAKDTHLWQHLVRFAEPRVRIKLNNSPEFETSLLTWKPGQGTGLHDHGGSTGALIVVHGALSETIMERNGRSHEFLHTPNQTSSFNTDIIHDLRNEGTFGAITLHVYRPTITRMNLYSAGTNGPELVQTKQAGIDW